MNISYRFQEISPITDASSSSEKAWRANTAVRRERGIGFLTLTFWGISTGIFWAADALDPESNLVWVFPVRLLLMAMGAALCIAIYRLSRRFVSLPFSARAMRLAGLSLLAGEIFAWANFFALNFANGSPAIVDLHGNVVIRVMVSWGLFFFAWSALCMALEFNFDAEERAIEAAELRTYAERAKVSAMRYQINPHFLFNSLNSISALILDGRGSDANRMTEALADFFRRTLTVDPDAEVTLEQELELQRGYLAIEMIRFPDLQVDISIPINLYDVPVPVLILQPLVENAIKHGLANRPGGAWLRISARATETHLTVEVSNSVPDQSSDNVDRSTKVGLKNVRARLGLRYGADAWIETDRFDNHFAARIALPFYGQTE